MLSELVYLLLVSSVGYVSRPGSSPRADHASTYRPGLGGVVLEQYHPVGTAGAAAQRGEP